MTAVDRDTIGPFEVESVRKASRDFLASAAENFCLREVKDFLAVVMEGFTDRKRDTYKNAVKDECERHFSMKTHEPVVKKTRAPR